MKSLADAAADARSDGSCERRSRKSVSKGTPRPEHLAALTGAADVLESSDRLRTGSVAKVRILM